MTNPPSGSAPSSPRWRVLEGKLPLSIHERLNALQGELFERSDPGPYKLAKMIEEVLGLIEQNRNDLTEAYEVQIKHDRRLNALEAKQSEYKERG